MNQKNPERPRRTLERPINKGKLVKQLSQTKAIQAGFHLIDEILPSSPPGDQVLAVRTTPVLGPASSPATSCCIPHTLGHRHTGVSTINNNSKWPIFGWGVYFSQVIFLSHLLINFENVCANNAAFMLNNLNYGLKWLKLSWLK